MQYRVKQVGNNYYPQFRSVFGWKDFDESRLLIAGSLALACRVSVVRKSIQEANDYIASQEEARVKSAEGRRVTYHKYP